MAIRNVVFDFGHVIIDWQPYLALEDLFETEAEMDRIYGSAFNDVITGRAHACCNLQCMSRHGMPPMSPSSLRFRWWLGVLGVQPDAGAIM